MVWGLLIMAEEKIYCFNLKPEYSLKKSCSNWNLYYIHPQNQYLRKPCWVYTIVLRVRHFLIQRHKVIKHICSSTVLDSDISLRDRHTPRSALGILTQWPPCIAFLLPHGSLSANTSVTAPPIHELHPSRGVVCLPFLGANLDLGPIECTLGDTLLVPGPGFMRATALVVPDIFEKFRMDPYMMWGQTTEALED
jgi:hypothetical protein